MAAPRVNDQVSQAGSERTGSGPGRPAPVRIPRSGRPGAGSLLAAAGGLVALLVLLVAVPALLAYGTAAVASQGGPVDGGAASALSGPDDGRLFLWALVAVGWVAWLCFALAVLLEIPAQLRGRVARRIPAFGWSQRVAAGLVGSVLAVLPVAGSAFAAAPARTESAAVALQASAARQAPALPAAATALPAAAAEQHPVYTVRDTRPADSLWSIAERQLGAGERWHEIAKLNEGRAMDDSGTRFDADRPIQPGWRLLMPADAKPDAAAAGTETLAANPARHASVTVQPGDSLSVIAQRELGDGDAWPKLFDANRGTRGPDGERLTDPDLVVPGMVLALPGGSPAVAPPDAPAPARAEQPTAPTAAAPADTPSTPAADPAAPADTPSTRAAEPPGPAPTVGVSPPPAPALPPAAPDTRPTNAPTPTTRAARTTAEPSGDYTAALAASTVGVVLAAAMIGAVARRRTDQQRARRPRHRIALPAAPAAEFEAELTVRQDGAGLELLNRALRTLARNTVRTGARLPALVVARITPDRTVELHLAAPAVPIAPFRAAHASNVWWCPADSKELLSTAQAMKAASPYPALVTLGNAPDGSVVLADLETVRLMHLSGHPEDSGDVLRTLAVELAHSPLADRIHLHLVGFDTALPVAGPAADRVHRHESLEAALAVLGPRTAKARATLVGAELAGPREARSRGRADEAWIPDIVLSALPPSGNVPGELGRLLDGRPRTCLAVITPAPERGSGPVARWTLPATGRTSLPGLHLTVELQRLDREQFSHLDELLRSSGDPAQHPAPDWTLDGPGAEAEPSEMPAVVKALADTPALVGVAAGAPAAGQAGLRLLARVVGTGASPFAGIAPTATPAPDAIRHPANGQALHAVGSPLPSPAPTAAQPPAPPAAPSDTPPNGGPNGAPENEPLPTHDAAPAPDADLADPAARPAPRSTAVPARTDSDDLLAILRSPEAHSPRTAPRIRVLGPADVVCAAGPGESDALPYLTELAAHLALRPGTQPADLDRRLHPAAEHLPAGFEAGPLPAKLAALTAWLGTTADGRAFLPTEPAESGGWVLAPTVGCDWDEFRSLYRRGMRSTSGTADAALAHALALVRGAPFAEAPAGTYTWAEAERQDMLAAIVDTAHELAARRLQYGDHRTAEAAIFRALAVAPEIELLHRDLFYTYASAGARDQLLRAVNRLDALSRRTGRDLDPDTVALLRDLLAGG